MNSLEIQKEAACNPVIPFGVSGTGFAALDLIFPWSNRQDESGAEHFSAAGGTCANVLLTLAQLGLHVSFLSRLGRDPAGMNISDSFRQAGVDVNAIFHDDTISSPIILQYLGSPEREGDDHWFSRHYQGRHLPGYTGITRDQVLFATPTLTRSQAFVFDRLTPETLSAAHTASSGGALVLFEPSAIRDQALFRDALAFIDILKFSSQRLDKEKLPDTWLTDVPVVIRTSGEMGLDIFFRGRPRPYHLPAIKAPRMADSCGSGDMVTAGLLFWLGTSEIRDRQAFLQGIGKGQKLAAMNCAFVGARGLFHAMDISRIRKFWLELSMDAWAQEVHMVKPVTGYGKIKKTPAFLP